MSSIQLRDGFSLARTHARDRIESAVDLRQLFSVIDSDPSIVGAGVVFVDSDFNVVTLREFQPICSVVVKRVILREPPKYMSAQEFARKLERDPGESKIIAEAINTGIACSGAYLSWSVFYGGGMAAPFTAGTSLIVSAVAFTSAIAGSAQCVIGLGRIAGEVFVPDRLDELDSQTWFDEMNLMLDRITLAGAGASFLVTVGFVMATRAATGKSIRSVLRGLSPKERLNLTIEVNQYRMQMAGFSGRFTNAEIRSQFRIQRKDLATAILAVWGSIRSGNMSSMAIGIYEE
jgi:hypothetical protein